MVSRKYQNIDRYVYTANNPINAIDPAGNQAFVECSFNNENQKLKLLPSGTLAIT